VAGVFFVVALAALAGFSSSSLSLTVFLAEAGGFAIFTGPDGPVIYSVNEMNEECSASTQRHDGMHMTRYSKGERWNHDLQTITCCIDRLENIPLGRSKVPFSEPLARARLNRELKVASLTLPRTLFLVTNILRVWRLWQAL
jgi:hypothetical protein